MMMKSSSESREEVLNHSEVQLGHYKENATSPMCYTVNAVFDAPAQAPVTHSLPPSQSKHYPHFQFKHQVKISSHLNNYAYVFFSSWA